MWKTRGYLEDQRWTLNKEASLQCQDLNYKFVSNAQAGYIHLITTIINVFAKFGFVDCFSQVCYYLPCCCDLKTASFEFVGDVLHPSSKFLLLFLVLTCFHLLSALC